MKNFEKVEVSNRLLRMFDDASFVVRKIESLHPDLRTPSDIKQLYYHKGRISALRSVFSLFANFI